MTLISYKTIFHKVMFLIIKPKFYHASIDYRELYQKTRVLLLSSNEFNVFYSILFQNKPSIT